MRGKILVGALAGLLVVAATAGAVRKVEKVHIRAGDIVIDGYGGFRPETLPKHRDAPITLYGGGKISTVSGELPPILHELNFEFDRHGSVQTRGLPVCTRRKLVATDVPTARRNCAGTVIGKGFGHGIAKFPEQGPIPASSPITLFNGPRKRGNPTVFAHAFIEEPVGPIPILLQIEIKRINNGIYGYRTEAEIPKLAGGHVHPISGRLTIGRKWTFKGKRHSYVNARCANGRLQARGEFTFRDGPPRTVLTGTFLRPCKVRH